MVSSKKVSGNQRKVYVKNLKKGSQGVMLIYFKPRRSYITQDCYEFSSISFLTACVLICILVPVYLLCIKGVFLNWNSFRVEEHNSWRRGCWIHLEN